MQVILAQPAVQQVGAAHLAPVDAPAGQSSHRSSLPRGGPSPGVGAVFGWPDATALLLFDLRARHRFPSPAQRRRCGLFGVRQCLTARGWQHLVLIEPADADQTQPQAEERQRPVQAGQIGHVPEEDFQHRQQQDQQ